MPYLRKEDRAAATRRWRDRKRATKQTIGAENASVNAFRPRSNVSRTQPSTVPSSRTSAFDMIKEAMNISANVSASPRFPRFKVRRISEIPEDALRKAGITRQGHILSAGPGVDIKKFLRTWLRQT